MLSPKLLQQDNQLRFIMRADKGRRAGLSPIALGPYELINDRFRNIERHKLTFISLVALFSLLVGCLAILLWLVNQPTMKEPRLWRTDIYFYAGIAELLWSVVVVYAIIEYPPIPWPWWGIIPFIAFSLWLWSIAKFSLLLADWRESKFTIWLFRLLWLAIFSGPFVRLANSYFGSPLPLTLWYSITGSLFFVLTVGVIGKALKPKANIALRLMALALAINIIVAARDLYVFRYVIEYPPVLMLRYYSVLFGFTLIYILIHRYRKAVIAERAYKGIIESRYIKKTNELSQIQAKSSELNKDNLAHKVREKLLRNLQDRVGSQINNVISKLSDDRNIEPLLIDCRDDITLTIDAINMQPDNLNGILASIRYRLEPRLKAANIKLNWQVAPLPSMPQFNYQDVQQLQSIIVEVINNCIEHSQASELTLSAMSESNDVTRLSIIDNGIGYLPHRVEKSGLNQLRNWARGLGAKVDYLSESGNTGLVLHLNVHK